MRIVGILLGLWVFAARIVAPDAAWGGCHHELAGTLAECVVYTDSMTGPPIDSAYVGFVPAERTARTEEPLADRTLAVGPPIDSTRRVAMVRIGVLLTPPGRDLPPIGFRGTPRAGSARTVVVLPHGTLDGEVPADRPIVALSQAASAPSVRVSARTRTGAALVRLELRRGGRVVARRTVPHGGELASLDAWPNAVAGTVHDGSTTITWYLTGTGAVRVGRKWFGRGDQLRVTLGFAEGSGVGPVLLGTSGFERLDLSAAPDDGGPGRADVVSPAPEPH